MAARRIGKSTGALSALRLCLRIALTKSKNKYAASAASKIPPSGRNNRQAPTARPHPSHGSHFVHVGEPPCRKPASPQIEHDLDQQDGTEIAPAEHGEDRREKCRIARQAGKRRHNLAGIANPVDAVLQPVHGDIGVQARIVDDAGKVHQKEQPQCQSGQGSRKKESNILTDQFQHEENIARWSQLCALPAHLSWQALLAACLCPVFVPSTIDHSPLAAYDDRLTFHARTCLLRSETRALEATKTTSRHSGSDFHRTDYFLRVHHLAGRAPARTAVFPAEARLQGPERKRERKSPRPSEEAGEPFPSEVETAGLRGQAQPGRRNSNRGLCSLGGSEFFVPSRFRPSDRFALSGLAARAHNRRPPAGGG